MKRFISFFLAFALLLSVLPFKLNSLAETAANASGENFNFFNADSYYWKKASWSGNNSLAQSQENYEIIMKLFPKFSVVFTG